MATSQFSCPHCREEIKVIPLAGRSVERGESLVEFEFSSASPSSSSSPQRPAGGRGFWDSEGVSHVVTGLFAFGLVWLYTWWYGYSPLWAVASGLGAGLGLAVLRTVLYAPAQPVRPKAEATVIQVERVSEDSKHWLLDRFDDRIDLEDLSKVSRAVFVDPYNSRQKLISREAICRTGLSQPKARLILDEFKRLDFAHTNRQNRTILTRTAQAFLEKVSSLSS